MSSDHELLQRFITEIIKRCKKRDAKKGKPWCLYTKDSKRVLGHHATPRDAYAQEKAIKMNEASLDEAIYNVRFDAADDRFWGDREWYVDNVWYKILDTHAEFAVTYLRKMGVDTSDPMFRV